MTNFKIKELFSNKNLTLGSAESFTGGRFASEITKVPGASKMFKGAVVTYATEEKINVLGVDKEIVEKFGVVSSECAVEMAKQARRLLNVDVAVSFTGNAGPSVMEDKPVGEVYIGVSISSDTIVRKFNLNGTREDIQIEAISLAYDMLNELILQKFYKN